MTPLWLSLSCVHTGPAHPAPAALTLAQDGRETPLRDRGVYTIDRRPFALRFPLPVYEPDGARHAAQVAGSADPAVLGIEPGYRTDVPQKDHMFFAPGMGMAVDASGAYGSFFLRDNHAHHYLIDIPSDPRMRRVNRLGPDSPDVAFPVSAFTCRPPTFGGAIGRTAPTPSPTCRWTRSTSRCSWTATSTTSSTRASWCASPCACHDGGRDHERRRAARRAAHLAMMRIGVHFAADRVDDAVVGMRVPFDGDPVSISLEARRAPIERRGGIGFDAGPARAARIGSPGRDGGTVR